jgi:hypothetical protein
MKAATYITQIRQQVAEAHGGEIPKGLDLTIRRYAKALELYDFYEEIVMKTDGMLETQNTSGLWVKKQHPHVATLLSQDANCQRWAKMLGLTAAKAAVKTEDPSAKQDMSSFNEFIDGITGK